MKKHSSRGFLRWLIKGVLLGLFLTLVLFFGSNLFLTSSLGQRFLAKNLQGRLPALSWEVAGAHWSPWNGITIEQLSARIKGVEGAHQEKIRPFFVLKNTEIKPYWGQFLRGKKLFREVIFEEPEFNIPVEYLIIAEPAPPASNKPEEIKSSPKSKTTTPQKTPPSPPKPPSVQKPQPATPPKNSPQPSKISPNKTPNEAPKPLPKPHPRATESPDELRFWLRLRKATLNFYSVTKDLTIATQALDADLPLAGPDTKGKIQWEKLTVNNTTLLGPHSLPVQWKDERWILPKSSLSLSLPKLTSKPSETPHLDLIVGGGFSPRQNKRNFQFHATLPSQPLSDYILHEQTRFHIRAKATAMTIVGRGDLLQPNTWRVNSSFGMNDIEVFSELRGQHFHFDTARASLNLQNVRLHLPQFSLRSERFSLLGNGQLPLSGYLLAVLRIVVDPEHNERLTNIAIGSGISQGWTSSWLRPLETPDRYYRDLHFEGHLPNPLINTSKHNTFLPAKQVLKLIQNFIANEITEDALANP